MVTIGDVARWMASSGLLICAAGICQEDVNYAEELTRKIEAARAVAPLGSGLFGDETNWYTGTTTFRQVDVDIPGNNALPVRIARVTSTSSPDAFVNFPTGIGNWELELPYVSSLVHRGTGWSPFNRCTAVQGQSDVVSGQTFFDSEYWRGYSISIPGHASGLMLKRDPTYTLEPTDGPDYPWVAAGNIQITCGVTLQNGNGEGFLAVAPDGTRYRFDWMVTRPYASVAKPDPYGGDADRILRDEIRIYATRVEDRFGNSVDYAFDPPTNRLLSIQSSDGRRIELQYYADGTLWKTIAKGQPPVGDRTWVYSYSPDFRVTLPDGKYWSITTSTLRILYAPSPPAATPCDLPPNFSSTAQTWSLTHPSGATGTFTFTPLRHNRTVPFDLRCKYAAPEHELTPGIPTQFDTYALTSKTLTGPGLTAATWTASYGANTEGKLVTQTNPDGTRTRYTFGTAFYENEGKLLRTEVLTAAGAVVRNAATSLLQPSRDPQTGAYVCPGGIAYSCRIGATLQSIEDSFGDTMVVPTWQTQISQDGATFISGTAAGAFDVYARPTTVTRSSSLGFGRTEQTAYFDQPVKWVVGQVASVTVDGKAPSSTDYDLATAVPLRRYAFGKLQQELQYNADGTLLYVTDGTGLGFVPSHTITLSGWKRGLPQTIAFPDGTTQTAGIDDAGWVRSTTNESGDSTGYGYDSLGRIESITYPSADTVAWTSPSISYVQLTAAELGFVAGTWRRQETLGTYRERTYYDARLRPLMKERMDTLTGEAIYQRWAYDYEGRETFASYPSSTTAGSAGINITYDALGRVTRRQTTDGVTLETISYPAGQKAVTEANGHTTTFSFQMFDAPSYEVITRIDAPEGQITTIDRDIFGNMVSATQSGLYNGAPVSVTRSYLYDQHMRLCKRVEPETNQRVIAYDLAGNVAWSADGQAGLASSCDYAAVAASDKTVLSYDARNRVTLADAPGTDADVTTTYWPSGDVHIIANAASTWTYAYNKRRLLESETLAADGLSFALAYRYNPQGLMDQLTYPSGRAIALNPDAFGRSRAVGDLATGISYHASGAMSGFTYGNGLVYSQTLDARLRPERLLVTAGSEERVNLFHGYDAASNITSIIDTGDITDGMDTRQMAYDGLHRLTRVAIEGIFAQDFVNSGTQSVSIPQGVTNVTISLNGGGGAGGKQANGGGGGGAGALCGKAVPIADSEWGGTVTFNVGNGGNGGSTPTAGTASTLVRTFNAGAVNLSAGGGAQASAATGGAGGIAGTGCVTKINGQAGSAGGTGAGGKGGDSPQGGTGGNGATGAGQTGAPGNAPGGGGGGGGPRDLEFGYAAGNGGAGGKGRVRFEWNVGTVTYDYDPLNNLRTRGGANPLYYGANSTTNRLDTVTGGLTRSYSYNAEGQVTGDGSRSFTWNGADRITEVSGATAASYRYDGLGKRFKTIKDSTTEYTIYSRAGTLLYRYKPGSSESTDYVYLGGMPLAELRMAPGLLADANPDNPPEPSLVTLEVGKPPQLGGLTPIAAETETTYLHPNLLGSPIQWSGRAVSGPYGAWLASEHYEAFGHKLNGVADKLGYTGHAHDFETELTYMQARFYDPQVGRFLSTDPVHFTDDNPFTFNRYSYANNNPYKYNDPDGEAAVVGFIVGVTLEVTRQALTGELRNTSASGIAGNIGKAAVAGLAGAAGVGIGSGVAKVAAAAAIGRSTVAATTAGAAAARVAGATAGGAVGGAVQGGSNAAGQQLLQSGGITDPGAIASGTITGAGVGAVAGGLAAVAVEGASLGNAALQNATMGPQAQALVASGVLQPPSPSASATVGVIVETAVQTGQTLCGNSDAGC